MTTSNLYLPNQGALSDLAGWIAGDLGSALVRLYENSVPYLPTNTCGDYTQCSFVGYAPVGPVVWGAPYINGTGQAETDSPPLMWSFTAGSGTALVNGIYVTDTGLTQLLLVIPFITPITLDPANPNLNQVIQLTEISQI